MIVMERSERGQPKGECKPEGERGRKNVSFSLHIALPPATLLYAYMYSDISEKSDHNRNGKREAVVSYKSTSEWKC